MEELINLYFSTKENLLREFFGDKAEHYIGMNLWDFREYYWKINEGELIYSTSNTLQQKDIDLYDYTSETLEGLYAKSDFLLAEVYGEGWELLLLDKNKDKSDN